MKKGLIICFLLIVGFNLQAQIYEPVKWTTSVEKISETEYKLITIAEIESGWHVYSQQVPADGPVATTFSYETQNGALRLIGNTGEEEGYTVFDPVFNVRIKFFENKASFTQTIKITRGVKDVDGMVEFMVCDDEKCLAPIEVDLKYTID